jgi:hypothetical protein
MAGRRRPIEPEGGGHAAPPASIFLRGLTLGALVGAAVAGSVLLGRGRRRVRGTPDVSVRARPPAAD